MWYWHPQIGHFKLLPSDHFRCCCLRLRLRISLRLARSSTALISFGCLPYLQFICNPGMPLLPPCAFLAYNLFTLVPQKDFKCWKSTSTGSFSAETTLGLRDLLLSDSLANCVLVSPKTDILRGLNLPLPPPSAWEPASFVFCSIWKHYLPYRPYQPYLHCRARKTCPFVLLAGLLHKPHRNTSKHHTCAAMLQSVASGAAFPLALGWALGSGFFGSSWYNSIKLQGKKQSQGQGVQVVQVPTGWTQHPKTFEEALLRTCLRLGSSLDRIVCLLTIQ